MQIFEWLTILAFLTMLLYSLFQMGKAAIGFYRDYPRYSVVFSRLENYEKHCFKSGLSLFVIIPIMKGSEYSDIFIFQVLSEIGTALAGGLFLIGVIAFIRELHTSNSEA